MEADWEFDIGGDAPVIEGYWSGFVDLRAHPERAFKLVECVEFPALADALIRINAPGSPVWTSKADVFTPETIDPDEMNATAGDAALALACYIDLLVRGGRSWEDMRGAEGACKQLCASLRDIELRCCRADVIVRRALAGDRDGLGATVYLTACGPSAADARVRLGECLTVFAEAARCLSEP